MTEAVVFQAVKSIHVSCVALSVSGFTARAGLMFAGSPLLGRRFVRVAPHVVDTLLLASALWLAWAIGQYPFVNGWLMAKLLGLLAYIVLGSVALKRGRTKGVRAAAAVAALTVVGYVISVAFTRDPRGVFALLG
ncbi:MAG TPA: SirB2 family protein [Burkholderiales bacterium]|nr:SirB2 family protein [Burkholderiales bacterium]